MTSPLGDRISPPLHLIWVVDCPTSMREDGKIQALNAAIREGLPHFKKVADENQNSVAMGSVMLNASVGYEIVGDSNASDRQEDVRPAIRISVLPS